VKFGKSVIVGSIVVATLGAVGAAYALGSSDFQSKAASWVNNHCTQKLASGKSSDADNETATICFNYYKNQEQDSQISSLNSSREPQLHDGDNNLLGTLTDPSGDSFYNPTLNKVVTITGGSAPTTIDQNWIYYTSGNCTGTAYIQQGGVYSLISLFKGGSTYYVVNTSIAPSSPTLNSYWWPTSEANSTCQPNPSTTPGASWYTLSQVSLPFPDPIVQPVHMTQ
jgi:hypothetical protein